MTKEYLAQRIEMFQHEQAPFIRMDGNYRSLDGITNKREIKKRQLHNDRIRFARKEIFRIDDILVKLKKEYEEAFGKYIPIAAVVVETPKLFKVIWNEHPDRSLKNFTERDNALSYIETLRKNMPKLQFDIVPVMA